MVGHLAPIDQEHVHLVVRDVLNVIFEPLERERKLKHSIRSDRLDEMEPYGKHAGVASIIFESVNYEHNRIGDIEPDQVVYLAVVLVLVENAFDPFVPGGRVPDNRDVQLARRIDRNDRGGQEVRLRVAFGGVAGQRRVADGWREENQFLISSKWLKLV